MSKPFNGAPQGPAPAQGPNQGVYDNPKHGVSRSKPTPEPTNDGDYDHKAMLESPTRTGLQKK